MEYIDYGNYVWMMNRIAWWLVNNNKTSQFKHRDVYGYFGRAADYNAVITAIKDRKGNKDLMLDTVIAEYVECAIHDNNDLSFLPAYVTLADGKTKLYTDTYVDMANRVSSYEVTKGQSPAIVYLKKENTTNHNKDNVLASFESKFGSISCIDDGLEAIRNRGYAYYYNSAYNTQTTINQIYNRQGVNCTDSAQLFYRLGVAKGYEVQFVHVRCQSGTGHVRLRLRKNGGNWFYRDPAAVLDGNSIDYNWCSNGTVIAYNPSWIFTDLYE